MSSTTTFSTTSNLPIFQPFLDHHFHPRKLLLTTTLSPPPPPPPPPSSNFPDPMEVKIIRKTNLDRNVIMLLVVLVCALISSLGLNSVIKCALRCSVPNSSALIPKKAGVNKKALKTFPVLSYSGDIKNMPGLGTECVICLSEFAVDERVRILPKCSHGFHVECIDKWLRSHSSCPTCRNSLKETCQKIASSGQPEIVQECAVVIIAPLEREDLARDFR